MKIQKINTGIIITKTAKQPSAKIEFSLDELDALSEFCERLQDEKDIREYEHIGFHLANDIRNQSPASEVLLTLCGWNIDTLLDKTPPIAIED